MPGKYLAYPEYKDSGVEFLGSVPVDWCVGKIGYILSLQGGFAFSSEYFDKEEGIPIVRMTNLVNGRVDISDSVRVPAHTVKSDFLLRENDVLIGMSGSIDNLAVVKKEQLPCALNQRVGRFLLDSSVVLGDFIFYFAQTPSFKESIYLLATGTAQLNISSEQVESLKIALPDLLSQKKITNFLDHETAKIDTLIEKQQQLIRLLKEKRQAVISHAVTKGLNPNANMRDSGVEWLGDVPEGWTVCRIKQVARLESGHTPDKKVEAYWVDCNIPWVSLNDSSQLKDVDYISDTAVYLNEKGIANSSARKLPERCVVFTRDASIGLAAITTRVMAVSQHVIAWICTEEKVIPEYLLLVFYAMKDELERYTFGATLKTIGMPDVNKLTAAFPSIEEQKQIIGHVFKTREKFDLLISKAEETITIIKERRTALISAAVTGKIDVRNWIAPKETQIYKEVAA